MGPQIWLGSTNPTTHVMGVFTPFLWVSFFSWDFCWALQWTRVSRSSSSLLISYNNDNNAINVLKTNMAPLLIVDMFFSVNSLHRGDNFSSFPENGSAVSACASAIIEMYFTILVFPNCVLVGSRVGILVRKYWSYFGGEFQHSGPQCLPPQRVTGFTFPQWALGGRKREERPQV